MTNAAKAKGDRAELEAAAVLADELGFAIRRKLGAGRLDDVGDLDGLPETVVQVAAWADVLRAVREKPIAAELQRERAGVTFAATMVRLRGGVWRVVLTPEQFATWARRSTFADRRSAMMAPSPTTYRPCRTPRAGDRARTCGSPGAAPYRLRRRPSARTAPNASSAHNGRHATPKITTACGADPPRASGPATVQHFEK